MDLISRQAAIDAVVGCTNCGTEDELRAYVTKHYLDNGWTGGIVDALDAIEQLSSAQPEQRPLTEDDYAYCAECDHVEMCGWYPMYGCEFKSRPSAQPERDIPKKPTATIDRAWGIPHRQAVCPKCDYYLGQVHFICDGGKRKVTYCETCGQAIDLEGKE